MPADVVIDQARHRVTVAVHGVLRADDIRQARWSLAADSAFDPAFGQLIDLTGVTQVLVSAGDVEQLARTSMFGNATRVAIVAPTPLTSALSRMYRMFSQPSGRTVEIFQSAEEAERWLL